jgi:hypothetical protein
MYASLMPPLNASPVDFDIMFGPDSGVKVNSGYAGRTRLERDSNSRFKADAPLGWDIK